jgi:hypothetical protein
MKKPLWIVVAWLLATPLAWADVAMLTQVSGDVSIVAEGAKRAAVPFLKLATGDRLVIGNGARVQMVYFGNGRQEVWKGGAQVEVGGLESKGNAKPEITQLPTLVVNQLARTPAAGQQGKTGMIRTRNLPNPDAASHLEKQYKELKAASPADDSTPEIFLLSGLVEQKNFARAKEVLGDLGGKPAYQSVVEHFTPIVNAGAPAAK